MKITVALSGGGVKGFAHIGVLRVLDKAGCQVQGIAGTSVGGLVGALYAAGYTPGEIENRLRDIDQANLFSRVHGDEPALLGFGGARDFLCSLLEERTFDDLHLPLAITSTDLSTGVPVIIRSGKLMDAVLATSAAPGVFPAQLVDGHVLVDGGVTNPMPVAVARELCPSCPVIAVVLAPPLGWQQAVNMEMTHTVPELFAGLAIAYRLAGRLRLARAFNIFVNAMDLTSLVLLEKQLILEQPDVIIRPDLGTIGIVDHVDIPGLIKCGEQAAEVALPQVHKVTGWSYHLTRRLLARHKS